MGDFVSIGYFNHIINSHGDAVDLEFGTECVIRNHIAEVLMYRTCCV